MMELLIHLDQYFFLLINHLPHTFEFNLLAMGLSGIGIGGFIWFVISVWVFTQEERKNRWFFVPIVFAAGFSLLITELILKNVFARPRPAFALGTLLVGGPSWGHSFPSGHATLAWAFAYVLAHKQPRAKYMWYILALLISFSRIYLGKHYPADILVGSCVGLVIGWTSVQVSEYLHFGTKKKKTRTRR